MGRCHECGRVVEYSATVCPNCGGKLRPSAPKGPPSVLPARIDPDDHTAGRTGGFVTPVAGDIRRSLRRMLWLSILLVLVICGATAGLIFLLFGR
jgi:hypothetical protein